MIPWQTNQAFLTIVYKIKVTTFSEVMQWISVVSFYPFLKHFENKMISLIRKQVSNVETQKVLASAILEEAGMLNRVVVW